jgi:GNAT superfamily N-acetyltransferase
MIKYRDLRSEDLDDNEVETFVRLVSSGGAVNEYFVRQGVKRPGSRFVFAELDGRTVGVAALKIPSNEYRSGLQGATKANVSIPQKDYPFELGYVSVSSEHSGHGIARTMIERVLSLSDGKGIFATTSHPAMKEGLLPSFDFLLFGDAWVNEAGDSLNLLLRTSQNK